MTRGFATRRNVRMESKVDSNRCHKKKHWQGRMAASKEKKERIFYLILKIMIFTRSDEQTTHKRKHTQIESYKSWAHKQQGVKRENK